MIKKRSIRTGQGVEIPAYFVNTLVVGAGAAGMNCAVHLFESLQQKGVPDPQDRIAVVTSDRLGGASRLSGSDKQTYYKLGTSPSAPDSAADFAETLTAGGCCHGDIALVEGLCSLREFYHLVQLGVPFPHDPEGAYVGYKTDHDPRERATSAGPKTSAYMCECLDRQARRHGIEVMDGHEAARLLTTGEGASRRVIGLLTVDRSSVDQPSLGLTVFVAQNVVLAAGGPGDLYGTSVYPHGQCGIHGIALEAGLRAHNLTESQFGLASTKFRWNVSGTYMQVIPRVFSSNPDGSDEREFLAPYFDSTSRMASRVFLKGYQWPFDPQRVTDQQSSLVDVLVYRETAMLGRRVFLDFTHNPIPGADREPFDLMELEEEAMGYLRSVGALQKIPIERLEHMNPLAIDIYSEHGIDIRREPLEINVCAQHNNGGFVVDKWWQANIPHVFVIGEMAGTHGVRRPGGSALNSGQVGGLRAAEYIANAYGAEVAGTAGLLEGTGQIEELLSWMQSSLSRQSGLSPDSALDEIQSNMSSSAAHVRSMEVCKHAKDKAHNLYTTIHESGFCAAGQDQLPDAVRVRHLALAQCAYLEAIVHYLEDGGGSRGSFLVLDDRGETIHPEVTDPVTGRTMLFVPENVSARDAIIEMEVRSMRGPEFRTRSVPVRPTPRRAEPFEVAWRLYRTGDIYSPDV